MLSWVPVSNHAKPRPNAGVLHGWDIDTNVLQVRILQLEVQERRRSDWKPTGVSSNKKQLLIAPPPTYAEASAGGVSTGFYSCFVVTVGLDLYFL